jgi:hypothetical protein
MERDPADTVSVETGSRSYVGQTAKGVTRSAPRASSLLPATGTARVPEGVRQPKAAETGQVG